MSRVWSFSQLKTFKTCQHKWHQVSVLKRWASTATAATEFGTFIHAVFEDAVNQKSVAQVPDVAKPYTPLMQTILDAPGDKYAELEMALTRDGQACEYRTPATEGCTVRGIADLVIINGNRATIADWKTGKSAKFSDMSQLDLMACMVFAKWPQVTTIRCMLVFVVAGVLETAEFKRENLPLMWAGWVQAIHRAELVLASGVTKKSPSGLCRGYCEVKDCEFFEEKR